MRATFADFILNESGATAIEYGVIAALFGAALIASFTLFGNSLTGLFDYIRERAGGSMDSAGI
jgi:pilus assembly protein Flp/PilA